MSGSWDTYCKADSATGFGGSWSRFRMFGSHSEIMMMMIIMIMINWDNNDDDNDDARIHD